MNRKSEIRNPKAERKPKSETRIDGGPCRDLFRTSALGLLSAFGFRISDFKFRGLLTLRPAIWLVVVVIVLFNSLSSLHAVLLPPLWRWSNPTPHGASIVDMAYAGGTYVQVGERGQIFTSDDLELWIPRDSHTSLALRAVTIFGGRIVITGENGTVVAGDDPSSFYSINLGTTNWLEGVAASSNLVVAVGDRAAIYISTNAVNWQRVGNLPFTNWLRGVAFGATNIFVAVGERGLIATSQNGFNWATRSSGTITNLNRVSWLGDRFLAVGDGGKAFTSLNGGTWQAVNTGATNSLYAVSGSTNSRAIAGDLELRLQETASWSNQLAATFSSAAPSWTYYAGLWDGSNYLVAGASGLMVQGYKTNGLTKWETISDPIRTWLWHVTRTPDFYLAVGDHGTLFTSPNGIDWDIELTPSTATNSVLLGAGGSTNFFLAVGSQGTILWATNIFLWNALASRPTTNDLQSVFFDGSQFLVCGGNGTILASTNGTSWTKRTTPTADFLMSIEQFPGGLVAVGDNGIILTSPNGSNWTRQAAQLTTNWLSQVRYFNGLLMAVGENGTILTSANGTNWTVRSSGTARWLNAIEFLDETWFIAGNQGTFLISTNASNWISSNISTKKSLYGLLIHDGQMIAVGSEGVVLRSQLVPAETAVGISSYSRVSGQDIFLLTGEPDQRFYLDNTTDLFTWNHGPLLEFLDSTGTLLYLQEVSTNTLPRTFFRTVTTP